MAKQETKASLLRRIEGYEGVQKDLIARAEKCESELRKWKPKNQKFRVQASATVWNHLTWTEARETAQKILDAGVPDQVSFE